MDRAIQRVEKALSYSSPSVGEVVGKVVGKVVGQPLPLPPPEILPLVLPQVVVPPPPHVESKIVSYKCACGTLVPDISKVGINSCRPLFCQFD